MKQFCLLAFSICFLMSCGECGLDTINYYKIIGTEVLNDYPDTISVDNLNFNLTFKNRISFRQDFENHCFSKVYRYQNVVQNPVTKIEILTSNKFIDKTSGENLSEYFQVKQNGSVPVELKNLQIGNNFEGLSVLLKPFLNVDKNQRYQFVFKISCVDSVYSDTTKIITFK